jgi:DNA-binding MarR family transcriptional regulator
MDGGTRGGGTPVVREGAVDGPLVASLLRRPATLVRHEVMAGLRAAGFDDILPAHLGVFQHPGPEGVRPGVLAMRTQASKQAMNHLLHQLEEAGYIVREAHPQDRRTRVVRLTDRGHSALDVIRRSALELEREWASALGEDVYTALRHGLVRLEDFLDAAVPGLSHHGGNGNEHHGAAAGPVGRE